MTFARITYNETKGGMYVIPPEVLAWLADIEETERQQGREMVNIETLSLEFASAQPAFIL